MKNLANITVADIVVKNINTAKVFKKYKIDYSINGQLSIQEVCRNKKLDFKKILTELKNTNQSISYLKSYNTWDLDFLIDFIIKLHHDYTIDKLQTITKLIENAFTKHGKNYAVFIKIKELFLEFSTDLIAHMKIEELEIFPTIREIYQNKSILEKDKEINLKKIQSDHKKIYNTLKLIAAITKNYTYPNTESNVIKALFYMFRNFEKDFEQHIHIENNILFPKAINLLQQNKQAS